MRRAAAIGLGDLDDPRAADALRAATTDPIAPVRRWAKAALRRVTGQLDEDRDVPDGSTRLRQAQMLTIDDSVHGYRARALASHEEGETRGLADRP